MKSFHFAAASLVAVAAASAQAETILQVKTAADNATVTNVTGIVVQAGGSSSRNQFYLADSAGNGLIIDKGALAVNTYTAPAVGSNVTILNGIKTTNFGAVQLAPVAGTDVQVNSTGNALPTPKSYTNVLSFTAQPLSNIGDYSVLHNVYISANPTSAGFGTTTWLSGATGGNFNWTISDGTNPLTLRMPSDLGGDLATYNAKLRPATGDTNDRFDVVGVVSYFSTGTPPLQIQISDDAGTNAKTDNVGPIRALGSFNAAQDWSMFQ